MKHSSCGVMLNGYLHCVQKKTSTHIFKITVNIPKEC